MSTIVWFTRGIGWIVVYLGTCLLFYPVLSIFARLGVRSLDEVFTGTYLVTGSLLHLPLILLLAYAIVIFGFHILGWADYQETKTTDANINQQ